MNQKRYRLSDEYRVWYREHRPEQPYQFSPNAIVTDVDDDIDLLHGEACYSVFEGTTTALVPVRFLTPVKDPVTAQTLVRAGAQVVFVLFFIGAILFFAITFVVVEWLRPLIALPFILVGSIGGMALVTKLTGWFDE